MKSKTQLIIIKAHEIAQRHGITKKEMAEAMNIAPQNWNVEFGIESSPKMDRVIKLADWIMQKTGFSPLEIVSEWT
jgi:hypothetical protein